MGTFYVFPDRGVCLWAICADGVGILPLLPCHDRPTVDEVREADHLLMWEVLGMVIQVGQVSTLLSFSLDFLMLIWTFLKMAFIKNELKYTDI